jgi:flagellar biosynthesis anti-sigma factor FlgM
MDKRCHNQELGDETPPANHDGNGEARGSSQRQRAAGTVFTGNAKLIEQVRQIIAETPEVRSEKVGPLQEAVEQGTYTIDVQKLADILIAKLFLDP